MAEQKKYIVKESFRYGGQPYLSGAPIEISSSEAKELAAFLQDAPAQSAELGASDRSGQSDQSELADLKEQLKQALDQLAVEATAKVEARGQLASAATANADLQTQLTQKENDLAAALAANNKNAEKLASAKAQLASLGKELGELKKAAKKEGGK